MEDWYCVVTRWSARPGGLQAEGSGADPTRPAFRVVGHRRSRPRRPSGGWSGRPESWDVAKLREEGRQLGQKRDGTESCLGSAKERSLVPLEQSEGKTACGANGGGENHEVGHNIKSAGTRRKMMISEREVEAGGGRAVYRPEVNKF